MAKGQLDTVHLVSSAGLAFFAPTRRKRGKEKLNVTKYDPIAKKHVVFAEEALALKAKVPPRR